MGELFSLLKILDLYEDSIYDRLVIDCAPTGETLALLKFPELFCWYMEKFFPIGKLAVRVLSPLSRAVLKIELPDRHAMTDIERLYFRLIRLQELLKDDALTTVRIVAAPEKIRWQSRSVSPAAQWAAPILQWEQPPSAWRPSSFSRPRLWLRL